jgi:hypothetical protein
MLQDRMASFDDDGEVRGFDEDFGTGEGYDFDAEDENPNLWEADVASLAALAGARDGQRRMGSSRPGHSSNLVDAAVSRWP